MSSCYDCIHCTREEADIMYYCLITPQLLEDGFGNGDITPCRKFTLKQPFNRDKPFGHDIIREEDGLGHIDTDGD